MLCCGPVTVVDLVVESPRPDGNTGLVIIADDCMT